VKLKLTVEEEIGGNTKLSLNLTLNKNKKVKHNIKIKTYKPIALIIFKNNLNFYV